MKKVWLFILKIFKIIFTAIFIFVFTNYIIKEEYTIKHIFNIIKSSNNLNLTNLTQTIISLIIIIALAYFIEYFYDKLLFSFIERKEYFKDIIDIEEAINKQQPSIQQYFKSILKNTLAARDAGDKMICSAFHGADGNGIKIKIQQIEAEGIKIQNEAYIHFLEIVLKNNIKSEYCGVWNIDWLQPSIYLKHCPGKYTNINNYLSDIYKNNNQKCRIFITSSNVTKKFIDDFTKNNKDFIEKIIINDWGLQKIYVTRYNQKGDLWPLRDGLFVLGKEKFIVTYDYREQKMSLNVDNVDEYFTNIKNRIRQLRNTYYYPNNNKRNHKLEIIYG